MVCIGVDVSVLKRVALPAVWKFGPYRGPTRIRDECLQAVLVFLVGPGSRDNGHPIVIADIYIIGLNCVAPTVPNSPSSAAKILSDANGVVAPPWTVRAQIGCAEVPVTSSKAIEKKMLSYPGLEAFSQVNRRTP